MADEAGENGADGHQSMKISLMTHLTTVAFGKCLFFLWRREYSRYDRTQQEHGALLAHLFHSLHWISILGTCKNENRKGCQEWTMANPLKGNLQEGCCSLLAYSNLYCFICFHVIFVLSPGGGAGRPSNVFFEHLRFFIRTDFPSLLNPANSARRVAGGHQMITFCTLDVCIIFRQRL